MGLELGLRLVEHSPIPQKPRVGQQAYTGFVLLQKILQSNQIAAFNPCDHTPALPHAVTMLHCLHNTYHTLIGKNIHSHYIRGQNKSHIGLLPDPHLPWGWAMPI